MTDTKTENSVGRYRRLCKENVDRIAQMLEAAGVQVDRTWNHSIETEGSRIEVSYFKVAATPYEDTFDLTRPSYTISTKWAYGTPRQRKLAFEGKAWKRLLEETKEAIADVKRSNAASIRRNALDVSISRHLDQAMNELENPQGVQITREGREVKFFHRGNTVTTWVQSNADDSAMDGVVIRVEGWVPGDDNIAKGISKALRFIETMER